VLAAANLLQEPKIGMASRTFAEGFDSKPPSLETLKVMLT
jgi:hypothetical protein